MAVMFRGRKVGQARKPEEISLLLGLLSLIIKIESISKFLRNVGLSPNHMVSQPMSPYTIPANASSPQHKHFIINTDQRSSSCRPYFKRSNKGRFVRPQNGGVSLNNNYHYQGPTKSAHGSDTRQGTTGPTTGDRHTGLQSLQAQRLRAHSIICRYMQIFIQVHEYFGRTNCFHLQGRSQVWRYVCFLLVSWPKTEKHPPPDYTVSYSRSQ